MGNRFSSISLLDILRNPLLQLKRGTNFESVARFWERWDIARANQLMWDPHLHNTKNYIKYLNTIKMYSWLTTSRCTMQLTDDNTNFFKIWNYLNNATWICMKGQEYKSTVKLKWIPIFLLVILFKLNKSIFAGPLQPEAWAKWPLLLPSLRSLYGSECRY